MPLMFKVNFRNTVEQAAVNAINAIVGLSLVVLAASKNNDGIEMQ